jgi:hypothetical protein
MLAAGVASGLLHVSKADIINFGKGFITDRDKALFGSESSTKQHLGILVGDCLEVGIAKHK